MIMVCTIWNSDDSILESAHHYCIHITFLVALVINFSLLVDMLGGIISVP